MFKQKTIKSPPNSRRKLNKNFSLDSIDSLNSGRSIYKLHDRLFNSEIILRLSKNDSNYSRKLLNIRKNNQNNSILKQIKNFRFKSFEKKPYLNLSPNKKIQDKIYAKLCSKFYKNIDENKPRISFIFHKEDEENKRDSNLFLNQNFILSSNRGPKNKYQYKLVNQVIKFDITKKKKQKKELYPMKLGKEYIDFIDKKNKLIFNPNFNSKYIHKMTSNYLLDNISKKFSSVSKMERRKKFEEEEEEKFQLELEKRDKIEEMSMDLQKYKKVIKSFLTDETKLDKIDFHEEFFDSFANKINFLFDDRKFPTIKNKLKKLIIRFNINNGYEWNWLNMLEMSTLTYLHRLKVKIQREIDEIKEENKEKQFKINQQIGKYDTNYKKKKKIKNINKSRSLDNEKSGNNSDIDIKLNYNEKTYEEDEDDEDLSFNKEEIYEFEQFFAHKGRTNVRIPFASGKVAYVVYNNPNFYKK